MLALPEEWTPHEYQVNAINWVFDNYARKDGAALFLDPGLGKTSITLKCISILLKANKIRSVLIVGPLRVIQNTWPSEIAKWHDFRHLTYQVLHGSDKEAKLKRKADIYLINYEGLPWLYEQKWVGTTMIVFDELTRMKNWGSVRVKGIKPFLPTFRYKLGLTGTPVPNGYVDLFSQVYMLDVGERFGHKITPFRGRYFTMSPYTKRYEPTEEGENFICRKIKDLAYRINAADWLKLPAEIHNPILLTLPSEMRDKYEFLKEECILHLSALETVTAVSAGALTTKLRQFLSGNIYIDDPITAERQKAKVHFEKLEALKDFVSENEDKPLLVAYQYRHEADMFREAFPKAVFFEDFKTEKALAEMIAKWNAGKINLLFGHPQSMGYGLNLQGACYNVLFFSLDFNLENYLQFIKRVSRQGQKESHVFIHYLLFKDTLDIYLLNTLTNKDKTQNKLLDFLTGNKHA